MRKLIFVFFLTLLIPITKVDAVRCQYSELARLKKIASNINTSYDYVEGEYDALFNITLVNLNEDLYLVDKTTQKVYEYKKNEMTISGYPSGSLVQYEVYATSPECNENPLYTIRVSLPTYNYYYKDKLCKGIESYSLCQKWSTVNVNYKTFVNKVTEYKKTLSSEEKELPKEEEISILTIIVEFFLDYYLVILPSIIGVCLISIYFINKKDNIYS